MISPARKWARGLDPPGHRRSFDARLAPRGRRATGCLWHWRARPRALEDYDARAARRLHRRSVSRAPRSDGRGRELRLASFWSAPRWLDAGPRRSRPWHRASGHPSVRSADVGLASASRINDQRPVSLTSARATSGVIAGTARSIGCSSLRIQRSTARTRAGSRGRERVRSFDSRRRGPGWLFVDPPGVLGRVYLENEPRLRGSGVNLAWRRKPSVVEYLGRRAEPSGVGAAAACLLATIGPWTDQRGGDVTPS